MLRCTRVIITGVLSLNAYPMSALSAQSVREASAELPGARIFYQDSGGSGTPVVFLHAATGSSRVWEYQIPAFTAAGYRFIAFDRRGWAVHSRSTGCTCSDHSSSGLPLTARIPSRRPPSWQNRQA